MLWMMRRSSRSCKEKKRKKERSSKKFMMRRHSSLSRSDRRRSRIFSLEVRVHFLGTFIDLSFSLIDPLPLVVYTCLFCYDAKRMIDARRRIVERHPFRPLSSGYFLLLLLLLFCSLYHHPIIERNGQENLDCISVRK